MTVSGSAWIRFLRLYGPGTSNDNQYDEKIRKSAKRNGFEPIDFEHPIEAELVRLFGSGASKPWSVILTGTAGDGKSRLCGKVWSLLGQSAEEWESDEPYLTANIVLGGRDVTLHLIRDLTGLPEHDDRGRYESKQQLLEMLSAELFEGTGSTIFLLAANDGQLIESWRRLKQTPHIASAHRLFESLLVEDRGVADGIPLQFFNLSRMPSAQLYDLAVETLLRHDGWKVCEAEARPDSEFFGPRCPIRHNFELLKTSQVKSRLRALFDLCDHSDVHIPIRRILQLLVNALLGHPDATDRLMRAADVKGILRNGTVAKASFYNNVFGGNLSSTRRESLEVFQNFERFQIGYETSNRIDNLLIFGDSDEHLRPHFDALLGDDTFYGADEVYRAAQRAYIEGVDERAAETLLGMMVSQRRGLFFKIPREKEQELALWDLSVFRFGGEFLNLVVGSIRNKQRVPRPLVARIVRGLNRVFLGMLVNTDRELLLATSVSFSSARVSQVLEDRISVARRNQEGVDIEEENGRPALIVHLSGSVRRSLPLNLTRFEFLSRVAEGALPGSFSRECHEDILAFKSRLLAAVAERRTAEGSNQDTTISLTLVRLDAVGNPIDEAVEFLP